MKYYNKDGKVGVLVSRGYGAGWSSWATNHEQFMATDKTLVEMCLKECSEEEVEKYLLSKGVDEYLGGWGDCVVEWLDEGAFFMIQEYDGSESLFISEDLWLTT